MTLDTSKLVGDNSGTLVGVEFGGGMNKWYVQETFSPDNSELDQTRKRFEFEALNTATPVELAKRVMVVTGWETLTADRVVTREVDLDWVDLEEDDEFDFDVHIESGTTTYVLRRKPFPPQMVYVVTGFNNEPIAVRNTRDLANEFVENLEHLDLRNVAKVWEIENN